MKIVCPCGKNFEVCTSRYANGRRKYCCLKCRYKYHNTKIPHKYSKPHPNWFQDGNTPYNKGTGKPYFDSSKGYMMFMHNGERYFYHRFVMEQYLGRPLDDEEVVHHINGDKLDNKIENLELFINKSAHSKHHWATTRRI